MLHKITVPINPAFCCHHSPVLGVVLISSGGHAQVPDNTLQFQPINAQPQQPQQQFGQQDQPQQSGQQSQWQQFGQQQSQPQQPVTSTSTQNFSPSVNVPNEHNPTHFPGSSSFQAAASPVVAQNSQFDGRLQQIIAGSERFALDLFSVNSWETIEGRDTPTAWIIIFISENS